MQDWFLALNPCHTIPTLHTTEGVPMWQTGAILRHFAKKVGEEPSGKTAYVHVDDAPVFVVASATLFAEEKWAAGPPTRGFPLREVETATARPTPGIPRGLRGKDGLGKAG